MVDAKSFLKNMLGFSVVPIFTALITVFVIPIISNVFPAEDYGKINIFYSMGILLTTGVMLGLDSSFIRYYFEPPKGMTNKGLAAIALIAGIVVIGILSITSIILFEADISNTLFGETSKFAIPLLAVFTACLCIFRVLNIDARMQGNALLYNIQSIAQCFVTRISFVVVAIWTTHYLNSVVAMTVGMLIIAVLFMSLQKDLLSLDKCHLSKSSFSILLAFGIPTMLTSFVLNFNTSIGKIILGGYGLYDAAGILAIATTLANVFTIIPTAFNTYWSPFMYKNYKTEQHFILRVHDFIMLGSIFIVIVIILLQDCLFLIVGGEYSSCQAYFMLIMLNPIQALICETTAYGIVLDERPIWNTCISIFGAATCALITAAFAQSIGVLAAAIGVAVSSVVIGVARSIVGQKLYRSIERCSKTITASIVICLLCCLNSAIAFNLSIRLTVCVVSTIVTCFLYRKQLSYLLDLCTNIVIRSI